MNIRTCIYRFVTLMALFAISSANASDNDGAVKGRVMNEAGVGISGAVITLTHNTKGVARFGDTNAEGEYIVRNVPVGTYTVNIKKMGYTSYEDKQLNVNVGRPLILETTLQTGNVIDEVVVTGTVTKRLDMAATTAGMTFTDQALDSLPIDNGFESMVLLTPGSVETGQPNSFRGASSIGGASSAENGYYLNGINVTQIQSGLGSFGMPWEAIAQTNIQTGGVTADFGGALGGIVNSVSKTGTNKFKYGISQRIDPESTYDHHPSIRNAADPSTYHINNNKDANSYTETNLWVSGPIVQDHAFFYALLNPQKTIDEDASDTNFASKETVSDRWFANAEWFFNDEHTIGLTAFNTRNETNTTNYTYDRFTNSVQGFNGKSQRENGGRFTGITYHGDLSENLGLNIVVGRTEEEEFPIIQNRSPRVNDCSTGTCITYSTHTDSVVDDQEFARRQIRADLKWDLDDHAVQIGIDSYHIDVFADTKQNGIFTGSITNVDHSSAIGWWDQGISGNPGAINQSGQAQGVSAGTGFVRRRVRARGTDSTVSSDAFYIRDSWQFRDEVTLNYGLRVTNFENTVTSGAAYVDLTGNVAPRLAAIWDIGGDGKQKLSASWGRYFQPVAARMNITQGVTSYEFFDYYALAAPGRATLRPDGSPERGALLVPRVYSQIGLNDPNLIASSNLEAMYSDQLSFEFKTEAFETMTFGVRATVSELHNSIEDTDYGPILTNKLTEMGIIVPGDPARDSLNALIGQTDFLVIANPGGNVNLTYDFDGDGTPEEIVMTPADHQLPVPVRKYIAWEFTLGGAVSDRFDMNASYTWAHSYGNTEGLVKSDNGQADPGWTTSYDYGEAMDGAYGNLPNDRRHSLRFMGSYDLTNSFTLGAAFRATSGRPINKFTTHPVGVDACAPSSPWNACAGDYIEAHYDRDGNLVPRGSAGTMPWVKQLDMSLAYRDDALLGGLILKATVYNLLNEDAALQINERHDDSNYGFTDVYQGQRFLSLLARIEF